MKLNVLVFINALAVAVTLSIVNFYFSRNWYDVAQIFFISLITSFVVFYYLIEKYVYSKIKIIYKLINNLKLGRDLRDALGENMGSDPIHDVEEEVKEWAKEKKLEIDVLKKQEQFRREFLSNLSHEFKTPLFAMQGYLDDNAFKYGKTNGTTSVSLFSLHQQDLVEVTDDGTGIEEKNLPRLFERFYRTDASRSRQVAGSGLGLAIVKHIVEAHQQTINVRSTVGIGSTFGFTLEKAKQQPFPGLPYSKLTLN
jgi:signal transduction histidine kinase